MLALGATVEARRIDRVPSGPQAVCHRLPNPAALVRAVDQNESRHCAVSFLFLNASERARLSRTKPLSALVWTGEIVDGCSGTWLTHAIGICGLLGRGWGGVVGEV